MRLITIVFIALAVLIQYPLWLGRGGWLRVHELDRQVQLQNKVNADLRSRNDKLSAEVRDLKEGAGAVEERARYELGMIKDGEVFVQIVDPPHAAGSSGGAPDSASKDVKSAGTPPAPAPSVPAVPSAHPATQSSAAH
jgi:cell division protein FtsB